MGFKEYKNIKDIARQQIETTLKDKQGLLLVTLVAVIEAFKLDPEKQALLSNLRNNDGYQSYYMEQQRREFLQLAEQIQICIANNMVNATMNSIVDGQAVSFPIS